MTDFNDWYARTPENFPASLNAFESNMRQAYEAGAASQSETLRDKFAELEWALKDVIVMLDDPTGDDHVRDMRGATIIARAALKGDQNEQL
jgi:hypothetical protein